MTRAISIAILIIACSTGWPAAAAGQKQYGQPPKSRELREIGIGHRVVPQEQMVQLITEGLADGDPKVREGALIAIAGRAGMAVIHTPENLATWKANREALQSFRKQIDAMLLGDPNQWVRHSAGVALVWLNREPEEGNWPITLDDATVRTLMAAFHQEPVAFNRAEIVKAVWLCDRCPESNLEARQQLFRDAISDADSGVVDHGIRGAAELRIVDTLARIAQLLKDPNDVVRSNAATAMQLFGKDAGQYVSAITEALAVERNADIRAKLKSALQAVQ